MHNLTLNINKNEYEMFCVGEKQSAWHQLGQRIDSCCNWANAMKLANLDWNVSKLQLSNPLTGELIDVWGTFRMDNNQLLGTVGNLYTPIQNVDMGKTIDTILNKIDGSHYESAGSINNGSRVWALAKLPTQIKIGNDISDNYIMYTNSHDGTSAGILKLTNVRIVCQNTLNLSLRDGNGIKIRHCPGTVMDVSNIINEIDIKISNLGSLFNTFNRRQINQPELQKILSILFPKQDEKESTRMKNMKNQFIEIFECNDNNTFKEQRGTYLNVLNATTNYIDHHKGGNNNRAKNALFGAGEMLKYTVLFELAKFQKINLNYVNI